MELIIIIFVVWGCYALFSRANKKTPPNKQSQEPRNEEVLNKRDVQVRSEPDDDELATFTISVSTSYGGQETKSNNKTKGCWITPGELISVAGHEICGGFFYFGGRLPDLDGYGVEASLVDSSLPIYRDTDMLYQDETLGYWPSFNRLSESSRGAYLTWLASERENPNVPLGYVFIYFYGLERRILVDSKEGGVTDAEFKSIYQELQRLRSIYGSNRSFAGYSLRLMELMALMRPGVVAFEEQDEQHHDSLLFRYQLATRVSKGEPIPAHLALTWIKNSQEYTLRTPARRCAEQFATLFKLQYADQFGDGMIVKSNKTRLTLHYYPASASLRGFSLEQPGLPDPSVLKAPVKKMIAIADTSTELLSAYSRYLGKKGASADDIEAMLLLPDALLSVQTHPVLKRFKSWVDEQLAGPSKGLVRLADLWRQIGLEPPERFNKKEMELITTLEAKAGFGVAPDPRYHHAKPAVDGDIVLFPKGHGPNFEPSQAFNETSMTLRLGAMVAAVDSHVDSAELNTLQILIDHDTHLSPIEKRSLHAYLHWRLNTPANMTGLKERVGALGDAEKDVVRHILVRVAFADGKVTPDEIKQLEKLYTALGFDKTQVTADVHKFTSSKGAPASATPTSKTTTQKPGFALNDELLALHASETESVQSLLGTIFVDDTPEEQHVIAEGEPIAADTGGLDQAHNSLFEQLITKERWDRKDVLAACESLKLMLDGSIETINDWAYEQVDAPVIDDDEDIYIDLEIANELKAG
ncbi:plasma membrane H+-transporting two-sector ATPase C subunit [Aeromonas caviae]|uniref:tellurite resistance TerB family protein n=1 Tax=Aeromonas caviae TaxID=648 RepID=UPI001FC85168|nr:TerB N-terminal domain-containing protein [Aeromonas caviae]GKR07882.1 plasma membrane H+-transporting two-sector ATPase C subunit [Aeromonas caviae]